MKSAHRHELETNVLAQRLDTFIERMRPYVATVAGVIAAVVALMFLWSYVAGSSSARQGAAWDAYHRGVAGVPPNLEQLRRSAEEYPDSEMKELADVTWADGQVWMAARDYLNNREAANEAMRRATSSYQGILQSSPSDSLVNRARLGLARIYEMQGKLEEARAEYLKIEGGYADLAKAQAERLAKPEAQEDYKWLLTAQAARPRAPQGPGTPGAMPDFSAGEIALPGATDDPAAADAEAETSVEDLLKGFDLGLPKGDDTEPGKAGEEVPATTTDDAAKTEAETASPAPPADETSTEAEKADAEKDAATDESK